MNNEWFFQSYLVFGNIVVNMKGKGGIFFSPLLFFVVIDC
jgi:hypothetical protein